MPPRRSDRAAAFTLIELMAVMALIALAMAAVFQMSEALLPGTRLSASATELGSRLELARMQAVLQQEPLVFVYDLDRNATEAYYPYERDEEGRQVGVGQSPVLFPMRIEKGMAIRELRLPGQDPVTSDRVPLTITSLGRMSPHEVVLHNPEQPEYDVLTLRISGLRPEYQILEGDVQPEVIDDASFR